MTELARLGDRGDRGGDKTQPGGLRISAAILLHKFHSLWDCRLRVANARDLLLLGLVAKNGLGW